MSVWCWDAGGRKTIVFLHSTSISASNWHQLSELIVVFFCFYVVCSLEKEDFLKNLHILPCNLSNQKVFSLTSCVCWIVLFMWKKPNNFPMAVVLNFVKYNNNRVTNIRYCWEFCVHAGLNVPPPPKQKRTLRQLLLLTFSCTWLALENSSTDLS